MKHHRERQHGLEGVLGDEVDLGEVLVEMMVADLLARPLEDEVRGGHELAVERVGVERVLAGRERGLPDALAAVGDKLAVLVGDTGRVGALAARVRDDDANVADGDDRLGDVLDAREQAVDHVRALGEHLELPALVAARSEEPLGVLEVAVVVGVVLAVADDGGDDLAVGKRRAVENRHHADEVMHRRGVRVIVAVFDHDGREALDAVEVGLHALEHLALVGVGERQVVDVSRGDDHELGQVHRIGTFAEDSALRTLLTTVGEKPARILEVVRLGHDATEQLRVGQHLSGTGEDVAHLSLGNRDERILVHLVHPARAHVDAAAQDVGQVARLAVHADDAVVG